MPRHRHIDDHPDLFTPLARTTDPETSHDAARKITPELNALQELVLKALRLYGPCTDRSLITALKGQYGRTESTWRTRRAELVRKGKVKKQGVSHGQSVWCVVE